MDSKVKFKSMGIYTVMPKFKICPKYLLDLTRETSKCRGSLYKRFPGLTRKSLLPEERKKLVEMGHSQHVGASSISLLKVSRER